jgi:hypothetical protein
MEAEQIDVQLAARLKRLDACHDQEPLSFDYDALLERHATRQARTRRWTRVARGTAGALILAFVGMGAWRLTAGDLPRGPAVESAPEAAVEPVVAQPRIVRADTYLAVAALEDHIASVDDALTVARLVAPRGAEVARLERTRAELLDSYARVRYAEMVSANF